MIAAIRRLTNAWKRWVGREIPNSLQRITGENRADERDRDVNRVLNDIEVMKRESDFYRRYARRQSAE